MLGAAQTGHNKLVQLGEKTVGGEHYCWSPDLEHPLTFSNCLASVHPEVLNFIIYNVKLWCVNGYYIKVSSVRKLMGKRGSNKVIQLFRLALCMIISFPLIQFAKSFNLQNVCFQNQSFHTFWLGPAAFQFMYHDCVIGKENNENPWLMSKSENVACAFNFTCVGLNCASLISTVIHGHVVALEGRASAWVCASLHKNCARFCLWNNLSFTKTYLYGTGD